MVAYKVTYTNSLGNADEIYFVSIADAGSFMRKFDGEMKAIVILDVGFMDRLKPREASSS